MPNLATVTLNQAVFRRAVSWCIFSWRTSPE